MNTTTGVSRRQLRENAILVLSSHRVVLLVAALAGVLTLPSLRAGLFADDYHHKLLMQNSGSPVRVLKSPLDMFRLLDGDPRHVAELRDQGFMPWWSRDDIKGAFWRPVASLTHWLDYTLWPKVPALMHAQSILWYIAVVAAAAVLYRRILGTTAIAGLAAILYSIDDAHVMPTAQLCNRNALLGAFFGILSLIVHDRWRRDGWRGGAFLGPLLLAMSLLAKEEGTAACGYLIAFAFTLDRSAWPQKLASLAPCVVVVIIWRLCWSSLGYGVVGCGGDTYCDPLREPLHFAFCVATRAPVLLLAQLACPPSDLTLILEGAMLAWYTAVACAGVIIILLLLVPLLRRDRVARFWLAGMLLALVPICAAMPSDRLLLLAGVGGMGLLAQFLAFLFSGSSDRPRTCVWRFSSVILVSGIVLLHGLIAPAGLVWWSAHPTGPHGLVERLYIAGRLDQSVETQDLVIVNPPVALLMMASPLTWASEQAPIPRHMRVLASSLFRPVEVSRPNLCTLVVRPEVGFLAWKGDRLWRGDDAPLARGQRIHLTGMIAEVTELTPGNRPAEVAFRFAVPLEDPSLRWLQWKGGVFVSFEPPQVGQTIRLDGSWRDLLTESTLR